MTELRLTAETKVNLEQAINFILHCGNDVTPMLIGHKGFGKSSTLKVLGEMTGYRTFYIDCTTMDLGDMQVPKIMEVKNGSVVQYAVNESFGIHLDEPSIIMWDEIGKANLSVKNGAMRSWLERAMGSFTYHPDSIVYATTNEASEGLGDLLMEHHLDRVIPIHLRKSTAEEQIFYATKNNWAPDVIGFMHEHPEIFQSYEDDPNAENPYIWHPQAEREAAVTGRSLEFCSKILKKRHLLDKPTLRAAINGAIGVPAASHLMTYISMASKLPSLDDIKNNPDTAIVPTDASAMCVILFRTMSAIESNWVTAWMTYLERMPEVAKTLFGMKVQDDKYFQRDVFLKNKKFTQWLVDNHHLFA
tara:strand:+ start:739 stop:1818 length:1080 start_codon:yes stop_codon:yes gene_type:complete